MELLKSAASQALYNTREERNEKRQMKGYVEFIECVGGKETGRVAGV